MASDHCVTVIPRDKRNILKRRPTSAGMYWGTSCCVLGFAMMAMNIQKT